MTAEEAPASVTVAPDRFACSLNRTLNIRLQRDETFLLFEEMSAAMRCGGNWVDAKWLPLVGCSRPSQGETSASASTAVEDSDYHDSHHKRAKVYTVYHESTSYSLALREYNNNQCSSISSNKGVFYHNFMLNSASDGHRFDGNGGKDEENEGDRAEDSEIRMDLTGDLLHMVFSFLDHRNLCNSAMVCRQWRSASAHEDFWRCLNFENRSISLEKFEDMCQLYPNATEVNLSGIPISHLLVMKAVYSLRNLEALTLGKGQLGDAFFHALTECSMLRSLDVNDAILGDDVQEILINHDRLCDLKLTKCRVMRISIRCPLLKSLSLKRSNMAQAALNCPLLNLLDISSCHKLTDAAIRLIVTSCPQLESLDMLNCSCVSDETLREIALTCSNLHVLNSSYCPNISLESVRLPMLKVLKLDNCEGITLASMAAMAYSYKLEESELDNCHMLTSVSLDLPRLQKIRLVHCRNVVHENAEMSTAEDGKFDNIGTAMSSDGGGCPMLKSLVLDNCESLTALQFSSTSLVSLSLVGCRGITTLDLACPCLEKICLDGCDHLERASFCPVLKLQACKYLSDSSLEPLYKEGALRELQDLDLSYGTLCQSAIEELLAYCTHLTHLSLNGCCPNIREVVIPPAARCFHMSSLNLSLSTNLKEVNLVCFSLSFLNLSNCCSLEVLKLRCPRLTSLFLQSCNIEEEAVESAISQCSMLETLDVRFCPKILLEKKNKEGNIIQFIDV
ncbi:hypothetical protein Golob_005707 [Gossypium lobatum]|uniref:F-box domain-containing protein n=1 Tax=Gossypium lobatum TaxID=34289 RepID=A0A7J8MU04_9ROSI|nr:hypothetical protein [Gossypium lobatum]